MADAVEVRVMVAADEVGVMKLIKESFLQESPLRKALRCKPPKDEDAWLQKVVNDCGANGFTTVAVNKTNGLIIGVQLVMIAKKCQDSEPQKTSFDAARAKMEEVMKSLYKDLNIFATYGIEEYVCYKVLNVRSEYRNRGIATRLVHLATQMARALGYKLFMVAVIGKSSPRLFEKLGYDEISVIIFENYTDEEGKLVLVDREERLKLMAKFYNQVTL